MIIANKRTLKSLVAMLALFTAMPLATPAISASSAAGIAIAPVYPENQRAKTGTFNLRMTPNLKQTIYLKVVNFSDEKKDVTITATTAYTSDAGHISIDSVDVPEENNLKVKFHTLVKKADREKTVTLAPNSATEVPFTLKMPKQMFDGLVMGGFQVQPVKPNDPLKHRGLGFQHSFSYNMPIVLKEDNVEAVPKLTLGDIKPGRVGNEIKVKSTIKNFKPSLITGLTIDSKITTKKSDKVLGITHAKGMSVAPNSSFKFTNNWTNKKIYPGKYHYKAIAKDDLGHKWLLEKDFKISIPDAIVHNSNYDPMYKYYIFAAILLLLLIMALWIWLYTKRKKKKEEESNEQQ
ncbi:DUF916 and DUF3324 domain-containing protein [Weissella confusa]|uniref:DUF916 and DUF3324 domain-containing protein n=1 Tax=Weissella confusa TaxID=1583 RepID=UPI00223C45F5|nr:DUF916 and DUF3324 domain-containing protein [Weissella confusa]MCT0947966.1 DUF916 and DUF3324 domain-containing protein [Weissella confusa]